VLFSLRYGLNSSASEVKKDDEICFAWGIDLYEMNVEGIDQLRDIGVDLRVLMLKINLEK
jgi:hypothetical protein